MRITYITAGAGGMYCGACIRDNALAAELMSQGHQVELLPLYTPTLTDEPNVSQDAVFFGGINVYLQQHFSLFRHTPRFLDRIWDSPLALNLASRWALKSNPEALGDLTVSVLRGEEGLQRKELVKLVEWLRSHPAPDILNLGNSLFLGLARSLKEATDCPICCTLQGEDLFLQSLPPRYQKRALELIRSNIGWVDAFIGVSRYHADFMSDYLGIPRDKIHVVPLGIHWRDYNGSRKPKTDPFTIGYLARIVPEKGLHLLSEAFRALSQGGPLSGARLEVAGYLAPAQKTYLRKVERQIQDWGLSQQFRYRGILSGTEKVEFLSKLDVLSVPASYDEPKGMYLLEAMASGVPVVQPRRGAYPEIIEKTGGGLLVDSEGPDGIVEGILSVAQNPILAEKLSRKGRQGIREHYSAELMAERTLGVYQSLK